VQILISTSLFSGVPAAALQRDIRSGRGLPTAFLMTSVMKEVRIKLQILAFSIFVLAEGRETNLMKKPRIVTWHLCILDRVTARVKIMTASGMPPA
jgi:hypothetical protein